jgi:hypothetical protein
VRTALSALLSLGRIWKFVLREVVPGLKEREIQA